MNEIKTKHGVPFVTYAIWVGGEPMKGNRLEAFNCLKENIGTPLTLLTMENIFNFEVKDHPFHPIVKYTLEKGEGLSGVHLSDYFRNYISFHHGGAYQDIKPRKESIAHCWDEFSDPNIWLIGEPTEPEWKNLVAAHKLKSGNFLLDESSDAEIKACMDRIKSGEISTNHDYKKINLSEGFDQDRHLKINYAKMFKPKGQSEKSLVKNIDCCITSNTGHIARPQTKLFEKILTHAELILDAVEGKVKKSPIKNFIRCCRRNEKKEHSPYPWYPLGWEMIWGDIKNPYESLYCSHISHKLPKREPGYKYL